MKKTTKTSAPASYKSTNKSGLRQVLEPIKSYLSELSRENNIRLSGLTVTGDTIRVTAETANRAKAIKRSMYNREISPKLTQNPR